MPLSLAKPEHSVLIVVDIQPTFMKAVHEAERVLARSEFLVRMARLLDIPVLSTEQNPERMHGTDPRIAAHLDRPAIPKMTFSCVGCADFDATLAGLGRKQAVIVGIETHICVSQTAHHLLLAGHEVIVCPDAVSARSLERHKLGMERVRDAGAVPAHTEAVAYEWMGSAAHPCFREALAIVKDHA